eukprot:1141313-Pelagomonas_calceolata.AAC.4
MMRAVCMLGRGCRCSRPLLRAARPNGGHCFSEMQGQILGMLLHQFEAARGDAEHAMHAVMSGFRKNVMLQTVKPQGLMHTFVVSLPCRCACDAHSLVALADGPKPPAGLPSRLRNSSAPTEDGWGVQRLSLSYASQLAEHMKAHSAIDLHQKVGTSVWIIAAAHLYSCSRTNGNGHELRAIRTMSGAADHPIPGSCFWPIDTPCMQYAMITRMNEGLPYTCAAGAAGHLRPAVA